MKIIYILFAGLCLLSCEKIKIEDVIREVEPELDRIWAPNGGEPVIVRLKEEEK